MPSRSSSSSMMEPSLLQRHHELQLQGPRPAPLKVSTSTTGTAEMVIVKKRRLHHHQAPPRQPVIIYVESPRVVHAHPAEFKSVVQRLTGAPRPPPPMVFPASSSSAPPPAALQLQFPFQFQFPLVGAGTGSAGALLPLTSSVMSVTVADGGGPSSVQENLSSHPFLLPLPSSSLAAACYHQHHAGGDLFIAHHQ